MLRAQLVLALGLVAFAGTGSSATPPGIEGRWVGTVGPANNRSAFALEIKRDASRQLEAYVTLAELNYYGVKAPELRDAGGGQIEVPAFGLKLALAGDHLRGELGGASAPVDLQRSAVLPSDPPVPVDLPTGPGPRWQTKLGSAIYASAATRGGVAYVGTTGGVFHAVRVSDGSLAWTFSAGAPIYGEAFATDDAVYFTCDNGYLFKLARDTGKELWRYDLGDARVPRILPHPQVYDYDYQASRPVVVGDAVYVGSGDGSCHAITVADGKRIWRAEAKGKVRTDPSVQGDLVVFTTTAGQVLAVDRASGRERWHRDYAAPVTSSPVFVGSHLILGGRDSQLQAVNPADGAQLWRMGFWGSWVESTAVPVGADRFLLGSSDLRRVGLYAADEARICWRTDVFGWA